MIGLNAPSTFPGPSDQAVTDAFLAEFRAPAIRWSAGAAAAVAVLFGVLLVIEAVFEHPGVVGLCLRAALCGSLAAIAVLLSVRPPIVVRHYVAIATCASVLALSGALLVPLLHDGKPHLSAIQAAPPIVFGLSLHYAFLRLPLPVSASIGWSITACVIAGVPSTVGESEFLKGVIYLVSANLLGMVLSHLVEQRERELFDRRRCSEVAEARARERQAAAEAANLQKTRLIAEVSHDLRQPMTAALSYLDVLRSRLQSGSREAAVASAERALAAVSMLGTTLDHLLTASRYDSGTEALHITDVALTPLLRGVHDTCVGEAERCGVRLKVRLPRQRTALTTDACALHRVLVNLVSNAIKFTEGRPDRAARVLVAVRLRGGVCRIDVIDTGIGIGADQLAEIWKPYVQLNNVERDRQRGLGLGLFLVQSMVEKLPGHAISMRSHPGRGSTFTLTLPAVALATLPPSVEPIATGAPPADRAELFGACVLVLEVDRDTRHALVELLESWGALVTASATMAELWSAHADSDLLVDAIVSDYRLSSGENGIDAIAGLRERLGYAPRAVLITGEQDIDLLSTRTGPETMVLRKPFPPDSLASALTAAVRAARLPEQG